MKSNKFLRLIIFCFTLFFASPVFSADLTRQEASLWAESKGHELLRTFSNPDLKTRYALLDAMFLTYVDLDYVAKFVMGKYWKLMTRNEQQDFTSLFKRYALGLYKGFPLSFGGQIKFQIIKTVVFGNNADVMAEVKLPNLSAGDRLQNVLIEFKLHKTADGIKIIDIKLAESSLILSYRSRFYTMVAESDNDMGWFLEDFALRVSSIERTNQLRLEKEYPYPN